MSNIATVLGDVIRLLERDVRFVDIDEDEGKTPTRIVIRTHLPMDTFFIDCNGDDNLLQALEEPLLELTETEKDLRDRMVFSSR